MPIIGKRCLVLNGSWFPIGIESLKRSIIKVANGRASVVSEVEYDGQQSYQVFEFWDWVKRDLPSDVHPQNRIFTSRWCFQAPEIVLKPHNKFHVKKLPLKAVNIFTRDGYRCWYCKGEKNLTLDHIIPKSRGGKSSWKNLITCCGSCNHSKGHTDVAIFCRQKNCAVPNPANVGSFPWLKSLGKQYPESWKKWLNFSQ